MTNKEMLEIAMQQSAIEMNCTWTNFMECENIVTLAEKSEKARKYLELPFFCNIVSYGTNIVTSCDARVLDFMRGYVNKFEIEQCFETPNLHLLTKEFERYNMAPCFMAEYFLPSVNWMPSIECQYVIRILQPMDFGALYTSEWRNALCEKRKYLDMLALAAFDGDKIIGMAGCSADCDKMWQIGVDVLPSYRRCGIASALTARLSQEIMKRGKVPFYCAAWANIRSVKNAIASGFSPAWVELTTIDSTRAMDMVK